MSNETAFEMSARTLDAAGHRAAEQAHLAEARACRLAGDDEGAEEHVRAAATHDHIAQRMEEDAAEDA